MKKLVKEYLDTIALRLSADYGLSFEVATRTVEDLDLLNIYKDDYDFLLHEDISTWVDIAYQKYITEEFPDESGKIVKIAFEGPVKKENMRIEQGKECQKCYTSITYDNGINPSCSKAAFKDDGFGWECENFDLHQEPYTYYIDSIDVIE